VTKSKKLLALNEQSAANAAFEDIVLPMIKESKRFIHALTTQFSTAALISEKMSMIASFVLKFGYAKYAPSIEELIKSNAYNINFCLLMVSELS
jgi:hypothetical protein